MSSPSSLGRALLQLFSHRLRGSLGHPHIGACNNPTAGKRRHWLFFTTTGREKRPEPRMSSSAPAHARLSEPVPKATKTFSPWKVFMIWVDGFSFSLPCLANRSSATSNETAQGRGASSHHGRCPRTAVACRSVFADLEPCKFRGRLSSSRRITKTSGFFSNG